MSAASTSGQALAKFPFKNIHSQKVPAFGVVEIAGVLVEDGVAFLTCTRPGTTLGTEFAVNGPSQVQPDEKGICYRQGDLSVAYDSGNPQAGQGWGPRANQWTLSKGYPSIITAHGIRNQANKILHGALVPLAGALGVAAANLPAISGGQPGTQTVTLHVWDGTSCVAATPTTTFTGYNVSTSVIEAGRLTPFVRENGLWVAVAGGSDSNQKLAKTTTSHASGAAELVNVWDGTPGSEAESNPLEELEAMNRTSVDIDADKFCLATRIGGNWYIEPWEC